MNEQGRTLAEKIADDIFTMIQDNSYGAGDKLPTEKELCSQLGAGRNTVREALKILASRNIVTIRQGAGSYVSEKQGVSDDPLGFAMVSDRKKLTKDLLQVRAMIEPQIAALAAQCASDEDVRELEAVLEQMEDAIRKKKDYSALDVQFHTKIAECTRNVVMENLIPVIGRGVAVFAREVEKTEYQQTLISHRKIFEYIRDRRPVDAQMEMQFHLLYNNNRYENEPDENKPGRNKSDQTNS